MERLETREVFSATTGPQILDVGPTFKYQSIQAAVNDAKPYDRVEIHTGTYLESVVVSTPHLTIEGAPGSKVVIQSPGPTGTTAAASLIHAATVVGSPIGIWATADPSSPPSEDTIPAATLEGFTLSNVTVTGFSQDGVLLSGVKNFRLSHVTATNNSEYGLFPIFCANGLIEKSSASGSNDTGIYVGQSRDIVVSNNEAHDDVNGIEIENSKNVVAVGNYAHDNTVGILEDLLPGLAIEISKGNVITANRVFHNNRPNSASPDDLAGAELPGVGIAIVGGDHTVVVGNRVTGNNHFGIAVLALSDLVNPLPAPYPANVDPNPNFTLVIVNNVTGNGVDLGWSGQGKHSHWIGNVFKTTNMKLPK